MTKLALAVGKLRDFSQKQGLLFTVSSCGEDVEVGLEDPKTHASFYAMLKNTHQLTFSGVRPAVDAWYVCMFEANRIMKFDPENPKGMEKFCNKALSHIEARNMTKGLEAKYGSRSAPCSVQVFQITIK